MEDIENKPTGIAGRIISLFKGAPEDSGVAEAVVGNGWEDSSSGAGEDAPAESGVVDKFPVSLVSPGGNIFQPYADAAQAFQRELANSGNATLEDVEVANTDPEAPPIKWGDVKLRDLTIAKMTVPSVDAPEIHITPYCGFPVVKGDVFSVLLNNGQLITS